MGKSVSEILLTMPVWEFGYWMAFEQLEPFTEQADGRNALLCATVANVSGNYKRQIKPDVFMPKRAPKKQSVEAQIMAFKMLTGT